MEEGLLKLIELVTNVAPDLWMMAQERVAAELWALNVWMVILAVLGVLCLIGVFWTLKEDYDEFGPIFLAGFMLAVFFFAVVFMRQGKMIRSPDYYAIHYLLGFVR